MPSSFDLVIFHYHLLPGGITTVIRHGVEAMARHCRRIARIRVVCGRASQEASTVSRAEVILRPDIDYASAHSLGGPVWKERALRLADSLREEFGGDDAVWWIHNYHLGKNPLFTEALLRLADSPGAPRMILQIHDFPEAGRYGNLSVLRRRVSLPLYPRGPRVRYALINSRDQGLLRQAGIPGDRLFLLENPVAPPAEDTWAEDRRGLRALLFPHADPLQQLLLYPVRSIRRKNVLEAGMLPRLVETPVRLVVTLPGVSRPEREYNALVEKAFQDGIIRGEFAVGMRRPDLRPERLAAACDMVVSSSVQEGFGYLYAHALQWGLPLVARRLPTQPDAPGLYDGFPCHFYGELLCPLEASERSDLLARYRSKLRRIRRLMPAAAVEELDADIAERLSSEAVDFSYLDPQAQLRVLESAAEPDMSRALKSLNAVLAREMERLLDERPPARIGAVQECYGLSAYAARVERLLDSFGRPDAETVAASGQEVQEKVLAAFARADQARLLFD